MAPKSESRSAPADDDAAVRRKAPDLPGVHPGAKRIRHAVGLEEILQVGRLAADPNDRVGVGRAADVLRTSDYLPIVARRIRCDDDHRTRGRSFLRRRQTLRAALRRPHPRALNALVGRMTVLADDDRAVVVCGSGRSNESVDPRDQFFAAIAPLRTLAKSGGWCADGADLVTDDDAAVARNRLRGARSARNGTSEINHAGGRLTLEGVADLAGIIGDAAKTQYI